MYGWNRSRAAAAANLPTAAAAAAPGTARVRARERRRDVAPLGRRFLANRALELAQEVVSWVSRDPSWTPWEVDTTQFEEAHAIETIDYATVHIWPSQWGFTSRVPQQTWVARVNRYLEAHVDAATRLGKPLVIEEIGMPRDMDSYVESSTVHGRDTLFSSIFAVALASMIERGALAGVSFSGWAGEGRKKHGFWEEGDPLIAEPPHEYQVDNHAARAGTRRARLT